MKDYIIYIPGLGDHYDSSRRRALSLWRLFNVKTELVPMQWYDGMSLLAKRKAVQDAIDGAVAKGYRVSVIGESAGATLALSLFSTDNRLNRLVTLCGVIDPEAAVSPKIYQRSPAFQSSMQHLADVNVSRLDTQNITVITSVYDPVVSQKTNVIKNNEPLRILSIGHFITIALCLTIYSLVVIRRIKK
ncbi:hypothetical protein EON76_00990 [bacterium]|nr:MAG: hypothetical protein EON76_00990 [bacterium]